ncbi:AraC family transcriptional regulator [Streptomyces profundus]|uniref:AraC family transcriptional regulator n=1 Tax=Streptomyces profundus TaxID=2867410 RepID=UPI001D1634C5|nr:AraC family transcriptional regulator [Streptomyces sp. MA3_2.13]UED87979.1 AraC family transcriptional regulator [Streptomyces sp. MA3_2.13]
MTAERGAAADPYAVELLPRLGPTAVDYPPGSSFGPRDARSYEFVWLLRGRATWTADGGDTLRLTPGTLLLVRPGMRDVFHWDPDRTTRHAYVHFRPVAGRPDDAGWPLVRPLGGRPGPLDALCRYLLWLGGACPPGWREHARETLRLLLMTFVSGPEPAAERPAALPEPIVAMARVVREDWADGIARPIPLERLAEAAGVSVSTLCRLFRAHVGLGPTAALERLRLARAEPLLWRSNLPLRAIAARGGFADAYHFSRRFSAAYGMAPRAFRALPPESAPGSPAGSDGLTRLDSLIPPPP